jgi:putative restriction endonuclease
MKEGQKLWSRDELILAINLYCKLPFGQLHQRNAHIIHLANLIGRSPGSLSFKLVNFASLDPSLRERGIKGAVNASKLDKEVWNEFFNNWEELAFESERRFAQLENIAIEQISNEGDFVFQSMNTTREALVMTRVNQSFFRKTILAAYNNTCCITGLKYPEFLIAGHIRPWSLDEQNRINPRNGIAINAMHDKAFEAGLLTILPDYKIRISSVLIKDKSPIAKKMFIDYDGRDIFLPSRFLPDVEFLKYHNDHRFIK